MKAARNLMGLRTTLLTCMLLCALCGLALWSPGGHSRAQQQDRQMVQTDGTPSGKRIALVIGNGAYTKAPPLKNPPNDARDMADALSRLGFTVEHGVDLDQKLMKAMIRQFGQKLKGGGQGVFYYAGHGVQSKGRNFLIPVDAVIEGEPDVEDACVDVQLMLNYMDDAQNGLNIVILDACRNNPFARSFRSAENGLAQVDAPTGTLIAYATAPGKVASDGVGKNGLYTSELLKQMRVPGLSVTEMFMRVRAEVVKQTSGKQVPWEASSLIGDFRLNRISGTDSAANNATNGATAKQAAVEQEFWDSIKNSSDAEDFRTYLKEYPNGIHAAIARNNLRRLETTKSTTANRELLQRSHSLWRACDYAEAINVATKVIASNPDSAEAYTIRGAALLFKIELDQAILDLSEAIRLQPDNALAYRWRAMAYLSRQYQNLESDYGGFRSLGKKDVETVLRLIVNPREAWEYEARGYAHYENSKYDPAISDLNEALRLDPQYLIAYVIRGAAQNWKSDKFADDAGIKDMSEAIRLNPKFIAGYLYRGLFLLMGKNNEAAVADLSQAIRLSPKAIIAYQFRGIAYKGQSQLDLTIKDYGEAIRLGDRTFFRLRGAAYSTKGDYETALKDYTDFISYYPNESSAYAKRAEIYRKLGRTALAEADEKKVKELNKEK